MTESLIPAPVAHTISLRLRQVPYKVTEELQSHGGERSIGERRYFSHKSLEPETPNPTRKPSHYITKLPFEILYAKVKSFPFHFLKTEEKKVSPKEGSIPLIITVWIQLSFAETYGPWFADMSLATITWKIL